MDIQDFVVSQYRPLVLIAGVMMVFLAVAPIVSKKYYEKYHESKWDDKFWPFSMDDKYVYDRYIRQISFLLLGLTLIGIAIYKFLYP